MEDVQQQASCLPHAMLFAQKSFTFSENITTLSNLAVLMERAQDRKLVTANLALVHDDLCCQVQAVRNAQHHSP